MREFPSGLVVRIWRFHCHGLGSISGRGTEILKATRRGVEKKKTMKDLCRLIPLHIKILKI